MIQHARVRPAGPSTRRSIAQDTLVILGGALLAILVVRLAMPDLGSSVPNGESPGDSAVVVGIESNEPGPTFPPIPTLGPVVNPSAGLAATPTPIPIITLGPPTPTPTVGASTAPTHAPTPKPTVKPTLPPKPSALFTCVATGLSVTCTATNTANATSWSWDWGDSSAASSGNPGKHTYCVPGSFVVSLTVSGPGGVASSSQTLTVSAASPAPTC